MINYIQAMHTYIDMPTRQRLEEVHWYMEVDHAWASELLKLDHELLFQMELLWLARPSLLHTQRFEMV